MISAMRRVYSTAQALSWALDLATALEYLHARSPMILHRDVKLSNVLLVEEGGALVAKLADMGLHMVRWWLMLNMHNCICVLMYMVGGAGLLLIMHKCVCALMCVAACGGASQHVVHNVSLSVTAACCCCW
jgi:hypothetical protein